MNICVTGTIGAGKSRVVSALSELLDSPVISADSIAKQLMQVDQPGYEQFVGIFGEQFLGKDMQIDRMALRKAISFEPEIKNQLEGILHPLIEYEMSSAIQRAKQAGDVCLYEIPLLFEVNWQPHFDICVTVYVAYNEGRRRLMARDGIDEQFAESLLMLHYSSFKKAVMADAVINNSGSFAQTQLQILQFVRYITKMRS